MLQFISKAGHLRHCLNPGSVRQWTRPQVASFSSAPQPKLAKSSTTSGESDDGPLMLVGKHYVHNPKFKGTFPKLDRQNYIDSDIKFLNYHSDGLGIAFSKDYDLCIKMNAIPDRKLVYIYFPETMSSERINNSFIEANIDFFENHYPLTKRIKEVYSKESVEFVRNCCRITAPMDYTTQERRNAFHICFTLLILYDDISEALILLEDPEPMRAFRYNSARIIHGRQNEWPKIDLSKISNFPKEFLDRAQLHEDIFADLDMRLKRYASEKVAKWRATAWEYFMDGVVHEPVVCQEANEGKLGKYSMAQMIADRAHSIGVTVANSVAAQDFCTQYLQPQDAMILMAESAVCCESDASTYFKENLENQRQGKIAVVNLMDWFKQVKGMSTNDGLTECMNQHNHILKAMVDAIPHIQPHHRFRYDRAVDIVLICNDYSYVGGVDIQNNRYGWYPAFKSEDEKKTYEKLTMGRSLRC